MRSAVKTHPKLAKKSGYFRSLKGPVFFYFFLTLIIHIRVAHSDTISTFYQLALL